VSAREGVQFNSCANNANKHWDLRDEGRDESEPSRVSYPCGKRRIAYATIKITIAPFLRV